jgi:hypothetical protein
MTINTTIKNVEPKNETLQGTNAYRAPRVLSLGTAVELLQGSWSGGFTDGGQPPFRR